MSYLKVVLIKAKALTLPVAWMISDSTTSASYERFFRQVATEKNGLSRFDPTVVFGDFDIALENAVTAVWPTTLVCGDYFHFLQANWRWYKRASTGEDAGRRLLLPMLQILYHSPTTTIFQRNLHAFGRYWLYSNAYYARYFTSTWLRTQPPVKWAKFGRGHLPSGDQALEAYNNRLKRVGEYSLIPQSIIILFPQL